MFNIYHICSHMLSQNWDHIHHVSTMFIKYHLWLRYIHHMSDMFTKYNLCSTYVRYKYHVLLIFTIYQLWLIYIIIYHIYLVYVKSGWDMVTVCYIRLTYVLSHIITICNISLVYDTYLWLEYIYHMSQMFILCDIHSPYIISGWHMLTICHICYLICSLDGTSHSYMFTICYV